MATDADLPSGDYLTYTLLNIAGSPVNAPAIDSSQGFIRWQTTAGEVGNTVSFDVRVVDSYGKAAAPDQHVAISVVADNKAPLVDVYTDWSVVQTGTNVTFFVSAIDDVDGTNVKELTLYVNGVPHPVGQSRQITLPATSTVTYYATAEDQTGNLGTSTPSKTLTVFDPYNSSPIARLTAPADDFIITDTVDIFGIVDDPTNDPVTYSLKLVPVSGENDAPIDLGTFVGERGNSITNVGAALRRRSFRCPCPTAAIGSS